MKLLDTGTIWELKVLARFGCDSYVNMFSMGTM